MPLARRFGLLNTMVFTHLPSNVLLLLVAFAPTFSIAATLLLLQGPLLVFGLPFILAGTLKAAYDLTLWSIFRHVRLHEETR